MGGQTVALHSPNACAAFRSPQAIARKTILVTGATGGLGVAVCNYLAEQAQTNLVLAARNDEKLRALAGQLAKFVGVVAYQAFDYQDRGSIARLAAACAIGLDGVVLMTPRIPKTEECLPDPAFLENVYRDCLIHPIYLIKCLLDCMKTDVQTNIVMISGISSVQVLGHYALSGPIRAAWVAQMKILAHRYGPKHIHFNTISSGGVMTAEAVERLREKAAEHGRTFAAQMEEEVSNVPLGKYADPREIASVVAFLLGDGANHMTGQNLIVDGGFTRSY